MVKQTSHEATAQLDAATKARLNDVYGQLPLSFEANVGQADPQIDFISRGSGYTLFLTAREAVLALRAASASRTTKDGRRDHEATAAAVLRMRFVGSEAKPRVARQKNSLAKSITSRVRIPDDGALEFRPMPKSLTRTCIPESTSFITVTSGNWSMTSSSTPVLIRT